METSQKISTEIYRRNKNYAAVKRGSHGRMTQCRVWFAEDRKPVFILMFTLPYCCRCSLVNSSYYYGSTTIIQLTQSQWRVAKWILLGLKL